MTDEPTPAEARARDLSRQLEDAGRRMETAPVDADVALVGRIVNGIAEVAGVLVFAAIVVLIFANAVGRYVAGASLIWAEELVIALIPWLAMSGMFLAIRRRQVIRIEAFTAMMPPRLQQLLAVAVPLVAAAALTVLAYHAFTYVALFGGDRLVYLGLPRGWFTSAMVIGAGACALAFAADAWWQWRRRRRAAS
jgi:TRAP-type C4-dicarboxylate transport system permease small subunit